MSYHWQLLTFRMTFDKHKTWVIKIVHAWFTRLNRVNDLLVIVMTGTVMININSHIMHNVMRIEIEMSDFIWISKMTDQMKNLWEICTYMIIDKINMLFCQIMISLNAQLMKLKNHLDHHVQQHQSHLLQRFSAVSGSVISESIHE